jgi:hypothetical protein
MLAHAPSQRSAVGISTVSPSASDWVGQPRLGRNVPWGTEMGWDVYGITWAAGDEQQQRRQCEGTAEAGSATATRALVPT